MKYYFITNPAAGKKNSCDILSENIHRVCKEKGVSYEIYRTNGVGDATRYVRDVCARNAAAECEELWLFACGGDGTLCEVVSGAAGDDYACVGLIPKGTGNDFVRNFTNGELFFDISSQLDGKIQEVDLLRCNDMYSINMINIGFDCEVVKKMMKIKRSPLVPSKLAYIFGLFLTFIRKPGVNARVSINGEEERPLSLLLTTIANGCFCGGGFHSNPNAKLTDGKINTLLVNDIKRLRFLSLVTSYKKGTYLVPKNADILSNTTCDYIDLSFDGMQSISVDGEIREVAGNLHVEAIRGSLRFVVPSGSALIKAPEAAREETLV